MSVPDFPAIPCPDCNGDLVLQRKPSHWGGARHPWIYLCENRPRCRGLLSAHPDGSPQGEPAPQRIRTARNECHKIFNPLYEEAWRLPCYAGAELSARSIIRRAARMRAYHYLAHHLGVPEPDAHFGRMTDIEQLREAWKITRAATPQIIRDWWKREGYDLYGRKDAA